MLGGITYSEKLQKKYLAPFFIRGISSMKFYNFIEKILLNLNFFKFRQSIPNIVKGFLFKGEDTFGYSPLLTPKICEYGPRCKTFSYEDKISNRNLNNTSDLSPIDVLDKTFNNRKNQVIFVASPVYSDSYPPIKKEIEILEVIKKLLIERGFQVLDYTYDKSFYKKDHLFHDGVHLNKNGSILFSKILLKDLNI